MRDDGKTKGKEATEPAAAESAPVEVSLSYLDFYGLPEPSWRC